MKRCTAQLFAWSLVLVMGCSRSRAHVIDDSDVDLTTVGGGGVGHTEAGEERLRDGLQRTIPSVRPHFIL